MPRVRYPTLLDRLAANVALTDSGCLVWTSHVSKDGYARLVVGSRTDGTRRNALVHRTMWEAVYGPIPGGLVIDHLCGNNSCAHPEHLEPVTQELNMFRRRSDACGRGHPRTPENTRLQANGARDCKRCADLRRASKRSPS